MPQWTDQEFAELEKMPSSIQDELRALLMIDPENAHVLLTSLRSGTFDGRNPTSCAYGQAGKAQVGDSNDTAGYWFYKNTVLVAMPEIVLYERLLTPLERYVSVIYPRAPLMGEIRRDNLMDWLENYVRERA